MPRHVATAFAVLTALLLGAAGVGAGLAPTSQSWATLTIGALVATLAATLGVVVARRADAGIVGALLAAVGLTTAAVVAREVALQWLGDHPGRAQSLAWPIGLTTESALLVLVSVALLLLYFPDGRLPGSRWRWVPPLIAVGTAISLVQGAAEPLTPPVDFVDPPFAPAPPWWPPLSVVGLVGTLVLALACLASLYLRYRRADRHRRVQLKWLALGGTGVVLYPFFCLLEIALFGRPLWMSAAVGVTGLVGIPVSVGIAMLRHDLYDVDKALAGAATWGLLSLSLLALYAAVTGAAGSLLGRDSVPVAVAATVLAAIAFSPLRRWLQHGVDQRLYPLRRAAVEAIDGLHRDAAAGTADPELLEEILRTALRDPALRVGYRVPGEDRFVDRADLDVSPTTGVQVQLGDTVVGVLVPGPDGSSTELLRDVATKATTMVEVVRLRLEVARALQDVAASRTRLLQIGYDERRRLERDLHDGAQQRLVSLGMSLRLAQRHLSDGTVDLTCLLDESVAELGTAVAELRQLAHGLRPSALDDGLPAALARLVRNLPMPIEMHVDDDPLPDAVATTAYFVIAEAVTNAVKHADATRIVLRVSRDQAQIRVLIGDDGRGGAVIAPSSGISDRVAALGGRLAVVSPVGEGTTVEVALPCAS